MTVGEIRQFLLIHADLPDDTPAFVDCPLNPLNTAHVVWLVRDTGHVITCKDEAEAIRVRDRESARPFSNPRVVQALILVSEEESDYDEFGEDDDSEELDDLRDQLQGDLDSE